MILSALRATVLALAALLGVSPALAQPAPPPSITVNGEAQLQVAPDMAQIEGGVSSDAKTAREASEANARTMAAVLTALKGAGIADADIKTSRLSLFPLNAQTRPGAAMEITGYRAGNRVTVRIRDISKIAAAVDTLVAAGANEIGGISFMVSDESKALDGARAKAIEDARRKAELYAKAAGVRIGAPLSISEEGGAPGPRPVPGQFRANAMSTPVAPGEETLKISVSVSYEILK